MPQPKPILVGAVLYDPKVSVIWDIIRAFFEKEGCPMDCVFFTNYELQVDALLAGHVHIAWNSPLAWVDAQRLTGGQCKALAMRDTDRDRVTHLLVDAQGPIRTLADLRDKVVATGALDSPQATLLPLHLLQKNGLVGGKDFQVRRFDVLVGKHGDHVGGERDALRCLQQGEAAASAILDLNWQAWQKDGTADPSRLRVLASTEPFDHCNFTALRSFPEADERRWTTALMKMSYDEPSHREMMDMEGLKAWLPGRTDRYAALTEATVQQKFFESLGR